VHFVDPSNGWVVGVAGTILHTGDGGQHWEAQKSGTDEYLRDVFFFDRLNGLAAARTSVVLRTSDGGQNWIALKMPGGRDDRINRLRLDRAGRIWAVGEFGDIFNSSDHGQSWQPMSRGTKTTLTDVCFMNNNVVLASGLSGELLVSYDGGLNWAKIPTGTRNNLYSIYTTDGKSALAVGDLTIMEIGYDQAARSWHSASAGRNLRLDDNGTWLYTLSSVGTDGAVVAVGVKGTLATLSANRPQWTLRQLVANNQ